MFLKGKSVFNQEMDHCINIKEGERIFYHNLIQEDGEGEPHRDNQEIIIS